MEINLKDKKSKVALCKKCKGYLLASHTDYMSKERERDFTQFTNWGFDVKIETLEKTKKRNLVFYCDKKNGKCEDCNKTKSNESK